MATQLAEDFEEPADTPAETDEQSGGDPEPSEELARALGWKSKDEYPGDADQWRDWKPFLDMEAKNGPQVRAQNRLLTRKLASLEKKYSKLDATLKEATEYFSKAEQRAYERAVTDLRAKQRAAVAVGDEEAFDAAAEELDQLNKDAKDGKAPKKQEIDPQIAKTFRKWERDNDWYGTDEAMTAYADRVAAKMGSYTDNDMDPEEYLEELSERVKKEFAHKFEAKKPKRSAVEGVGETRPTKGQKTFDNLPREAQIQCDRFIEQKIIKDRAAYLKSYSWE